MAATKLLANTLKNILSDPVEGFTVELVDESNLFEWRIFIEGPKDTLYEGGVFQMNMKFPTDFPMSPPELRFTSDFWHPNVYRETGLVCISILHPPGEDEMSGESASERWLPTQTVTTILLSVISLLNAPNFSSPANVDAGVEWRNDPNGYKKKCLRLVEKANKEKPSYVVIPHPDTNNEEREKQIQKIKNLNKSIEEDDDFMNDNDVIEDSEEDSEEDTDPESEEEEKKNEKNSKSKQEKNEKKSKSEKHSSGKDEDEAIERDKDRDSKGKYSKQEAADENKNKKESPREGTNLTKNKRSKKKKCIIM